jgi:hypothetical protein
MNIGQLLYSLPLRLRSFFHPNQVDQETKEELREHLEQQISAMGGSLRSNNSVATPGVESSCGILSRTCATALVNCAAVQGFLPWSSCV